MKLPFYQDNVAPLLYVFSVRRRFLWSDLLNQGIAKPFKEPIGLHCRQLAGLYLDAQPDPQCVDNGEGFGFRVVAQHLFPLVQLNGVMAVVSIVIIGKAEGWKENRQK